MDSIEAPMDELGPLFLGHKKRKWLDQEIGDDNSVYCKDTRCNGEILNIAWSDGGLAVQEFVKIHQLM